MLLQRGKLEANFRFECELKGVLSSCKQFLSGLGMKSNSLYHKDRKIGRKKLKSNEYFK